MRLGSLSSVARHRQQNDAKLGKLLALEGDDDNICDSDIDILHRKRTLYDARRFNREPDECGIIEP